MFLFNISWGDENFISFFSFYLFFHYFTWIGKFSFIKIKFIFFSRVSQNLSFLLHPTDKIIKVEMKLSSSREVSFLCCFSLYFCEEFYSWSWRISSFSDIFIWLDKTKAYKKNYYIDRIIISSKKFSTIHPILNTM